jgi:hypothetical protein
MDQAPVAMSFEGSIKPNNPVKFRKISRPLLGASSNRSVKLVAAHNSGNILQTRRSAYEESDFQSGSSDFWYVSVRAIPLSMKKTDTAYTPSLPCAVEASQTPEAHLSK